MRKITIAGLGACLGAALLLSGGAARAQVSYELALSPTNTTNINSLRPGEFVRLDVFLNVASTATSTLDVRAFQAAFAVNPNFITATAQSSFQFTASSTVTDANLSSGGNFRRQITDGGGSDATNTIVLGRSQGATGQDDNTTFASPGSRTLLGTFRFTVAANAPQGQSTLLGFSDVISDTPFTNASNPNLYTTRTGGVGSATTQNRVTSFSDSISQTNDPVAGTIRLTTVPGPAAIVPFLLGGSLLGARLRRKKASA